MPAAVLALLFCPSFSWAEPPAAAPPDQEPQKFKVHTGGELPFHVVDFLSGKHAGHCGCPSVMINNRGARGLVIWTKGFDDASFQLVAEADKQWLDGSKKQAYFVLFDAQEEALKTKLEKTPLKHASAGHPRHTSEVQFRNYEIDKTAQQFVFLVEGKEIKQMWTLHAGELKKEKQEEILKAMGKHFGE